MTRDKMGVPSANHNKFEQSAAPASGKYGGFGSEDISKLGYQPGKFNTVYDPYTKKDEPKKSAED